jgi:hypothetical protein
MSGEKTNIELGIQVDDKRLTQLQRKLSRTKKNLIEMQKAGMKGDQFKHQARELQRQIAYRKHSLKLQQQQAALQKAQNMAASKFTGFIQKGQHAQIGFNGAALSGLFFGMQLQKTFGGALKSIFEGYKKIIPESHEFNKMTTRLSANWQFFKFQLADALSNSPLFQSLISFSIKLLQVLQGLPAPVKSFLMYAMLAAAALGAWLFTTNTLRLGLAGISDQMGLINAATGKFSWGKMGTTAGIGAAVLAVAGLTAGMFELQSGSETATKKWEKFKEGMVGVANSIFNPMAEAMGAVGFELKDLNEVWLVAGAIWQNVLVALGTMFNALVPLIRTVFNALTILARTAHNAAQIMADFWSMDFKGVMDNFRDLRDGVVQDIDDIANAWSESQKNFEDLQAGVLTPDDIRQSIQEYRASQQKEATGGMTTNVIIDGNIQSISPELAETADKFTKALTGDVLGSSGR